MSPEAATEKVAAAPAVTDWSAGCALMAGGGGFPEPGGGRSESSDEHPTMPNRTSRPEMRHFIGSFLCDSGKIAGVSTGIRKSRRGPVRATGRK